MSGYWEVIAPIGLAGMAAVVVLARMLRHRGTHVAHRDRADLERQAYDVTTATVPAAPTVGRPPWEQTAAAPIVTEPATLGTWEPKLRAALAAEVDGIEPEPMWQYEAATRALADKYARIPLPAAPLPAPTLEPEPEPEQLGQLEQLTPAQIVKRYELPPHVAALAAAVREQHARSCPTCLAEQRPWYDGAWMDEQLGILFAWVRRVRQQLAP